jgi:serine protease Do
VDVLAGSSRPLLALLVALPTVVSAQSARPLMGPMCVGEYADDLQALMPRAREFERQTYSYCVRNTATYECLSYGADGNVRRSRRRAVMHGTAFGYRQQNGETLLLTNQHAAEWPAVTDDEHPVEGVPLGCKKVGDALRVVDSESDAYDRDDVPLQRVVSDPQLDVAVLRAHTLLPILPWRIGRSAALRERNVVEVRGFPLGAFQATNVGKVISAFDHDTYKEWDHDDFVVDALLSTGNSGSPVLAVSCRTGEFELVGIYHAGYSEGSALNVVVGIDQVRGLMTTLKRAPPRHGEPQALDASARAKLLGAADPFFPFGSLTAQVRSRSDGALLFEVMSRDFPLRTHPIVVIEDLPPVGPADPFGEVGRIWIGAAAGLKPYLHADLDADAQALMRRALELLRHDALSAFAYRAAARDGQKTRERFDQMTRLERALRHERDARRDVAQQLSEMSERLQPHASDTTVPIADLFVVPAMRPPSAAPAVVDAEH